MAMCLIKKIPKQLILRNLNIRQCYNKTNKCDIFVKPKLNIYQRNLEKYPIMFQMVQTGLIMGLGDWLSQTFVENVSFKDYNYVRTLKFSAIGFCYLGPVLRIWYGRIDRLIIEKNPIKRGLKKMLIDQTLFAPPFIASVLFLINFTESYNIENSINKVKNIYFEVLKMNYVVWPLAQTINFSLLPLNYQVFFAQIVSIFWNTYLSAKTNKSQKKGIE